jgi:ABC-type transport system substrate-binding protein
LHRRVESVWIFEEGAVTRVGQNAAFRARDQRGRPRAANSPDPQTGFLKTLLTTSRTPGGLNWGWYQNDELDALGRQIMTTFDPDQQLALIQTAHEVAVKDSARIFIVDDLNPRALSPRLKGFVQAQSWYQDLEPIVVTNPVN